MDEKTMESIFRDVGIRGGFDRVQAQFMEYRDFKVKWVRSYKWIEFNVSDYLRDAPEDVMSSIAATIIGKIGGEDGVRYTQEVCDWLTSDGFVRRNQPVYLGRYPGLATDPRGARWDLGESRRRLVEMGLVEDDPMLVVAWRSGTRSSSAGHASVLMRTAVLSRSLDRDEVPQDVLDYCLYAQMLHVQMGFSPTGEKRNAEFCERLAEYPDQKGVESRMRSLCIHL